MLDGLLHHRFAEHAARAPEREALVWDGGSMSYGELERRANQLAHRLQRDGVGPESLVAIYLPRSPQMLVAVLGVLKAGGGYVPFDPSYPADRIAFMVEDSCASMILTESSLAAALPPHVPKLVLDGDELRAEQATAPSCKATPENVAYVIYTSGSTGKPKGVQISHHCMARLFDATDEWFRFGPDDTWTLFHSLAFDFSVWEIWGALAFGGRLVVVSYETSRSPREFYELLCRARVSVLNQTPSAFYQLIAAEEDLGERGERLSLREVIFGGEALDFRALRRWVDRHGVKRPRLVNMYGITETTVHVTYRPLAEADIAAGTSSLIGRPIPDLRVHVLDEKLDPAVVGELGEIYVTGAGLARGYLGRPALTALRFVPDPFGSTPGSRMYRSGDLARTHADDIEYAGRIDLQVKIRGFRIELGEIESRLAQHASVRECVVLAREDVPGVQQLVAYIVPRTSLDVRALREDLGAYLPDYMVPAAFVELDRFLLTPNGKLDRKALPAPSRRSQQIIVAPRGDVERAIADICSTLLDVSPIGMDDDFFDLGGNSLVAMRLTSLVRARLEVELPIRAIWEGRTIAAIAASAMAAPGVPARRLTHVDRPAAVPLSFAQGRLWFLDQLDPGQPTYNVAQAIRLAAAEPLDVEALVHSFEAIVRRHEILRTTFPVQGDQPIQRISDATVAPDVLDLRHLDAASQQRELARLAHDQAVQPFDLARGPLVRARLIRVTDRDATLLLALHHIIIDGWSVSVLLEELAALYGARRAGRPSPLAELAMQYADYTLWQRAQLTPERERELFAYWERQLAGCPPAELPTDHAPPIVRSHRGARLPIHLPLEVLNGVRELARRDGGSTFAVALSAFQVLLHRYSGQDDIAVCSVLANRTRVETDRLIGFFVNSFVVRSDLSRASSFRELVGQVREAVLGAHAHQELPFDRMVELLRPELRLGRAQMTTAWFAMHNRPVAPASESLAMALEEIPTGTSKFDLIVSLEETEQGFEGYLEYDTELFEASTAERLLVHYGQLLAGLIERPDLAIREVPLATEAELRLLREEWSASARHEPLALCIHEVFEQQAGQTPDAIALAYEDRRLTYRELDERANALAALLVAEGVARDELVGISAARSIETVIGLLAILKAGAAYLPLDLADPTARIEAMITKVGMRLLLAPPSTAGQVPRRARVVWLDAHGEGARLARRPDRRCTPDNLAYAMFTSGSTGTPKAVAVSHGSVIRLVRAQSYLSITPADVFLQLAPLAFDASTLEIWGALLNGARLSIAAPGPRSIEEISCDVREHEVTTLWLTAGLFQQVVDAGLADYRSVRHFLTGGDVVSPAHARKALAVLPGCTLYNGYGPTENTTFTTVHAMRAPQEVGNTVAIGHAISRTTVYVLDRQLRPAAIGELGRLYTGGRGLARGYLGQPELTAERFVPDPFGAPGARMYDTGDLVRVRPDGSLEFVGRADQQVKIRGFRIELGEIAAALSAHPSVRSSVVVARGDADDKRLVAYVVPVGTPDLAVLRAHLHERLPAYMVPAAFVVLDALPLTPNGKVDYKALPAPDGKVERDRQFVPPRTPTEELLAGMWADLLHVDRVSIDDDFFDLGGHSLLATRLISRVRARFHVELPLRSVFEDRSVAAMARTIATANHDEVASIERAPRGADLPLSLAQQRLWLIDQLEPGSPLYNLPLVVRLVGELDVPALVRALSDLQARHESLRSTFLKRDGRPAVVLSDAPFAISQIDLRRSEMPEREASERVAAEIVRPFDLANELPWRVLLLRCGSIQHVLVVTMHHIVSDGWSVGVLARELGAAYNAHHAGRAPSLPPLPIQYYDFASWQQTHWTDQVLAEQLAYWKRELADSPAVLEVPLDRPRTTAPSHRGGRHRFALPAKLTRELEALAQAHGATLYMTMLAAFQTLLHRWSGHRDILVASPLAGRNRGELEGIIGFFVNMVVMRTSFAGSPTFSELVDRVRETALSAFAHQDVPFDRVIEEINPERSLSYAPLVQVTFDLNKRHAADLELTGVASSVELGDTLVAQFDLSMTVVHAERLEVEIEFARDLFDESTIVRLGRQFERLLGGIVTRPHAAVSKIELIDPQERAALIDEPARRVDWDASGPGVIEQIEAIMQRTPDAPAIISHDGELTYRELDRLSGRLAAMLRARGVGPDRTVAVIAHRGAQQIVGVLGVLRAGGAYVPISPELPDERLRWVLEETSPVALLCDRPLPQAVAQHARAVIRLDEPEAWPDPAACEPQAIPPDALAYIIYTSGSTGRPKGVMVTRHNFDAQMRWIQREFALSADDRCLQLHSFTFDASVSEIFWPLVAGGAMVLPRPRGELEAAYLGELIRTTRTTVVHFVPTMMWSLIENLDTAHWQSVRWLVSGGEALTPELALRCARELPRAELVNTYGPTETTVNATSWRHCEADPSVPIGLPVADTTAYVLDDDLGPVPAGTIGELWIGGVQVTRGYKQRPGLTAERFVPDPFAARPGKRMYRTGDLVRQRETGVLDYVGRSDFQVKVRGFRIELGEIEAALRSQAGVREAVVIAHDRNGSKQLVGYVVGDESLASGLEALTEALSTRLPSYMVPTSLVWLGELPRTASGKLDRKALPEPSSPARSGIGKAPETTMQRQLAALWCELLGIERVTVEDNFFALGGHSLVVMRLIARISRELAIELRPQVVFESPTLGALAARAERRLAEQGTPDDPAAKELASYVAGLSEAEAAQHRIDVHPSLPLARSESPSPPITFAQQHQWDVHQRGNFPALSGQACAYALHGPIDARAMSGAIASLVQRQAALRTVFATDARGELAQTVRERGPELEIIDLESSSDRDTKLRELFAESSRRHDLAREAFRAQLVRVHANEHVLTLAPHHIVNDGFSWDVLETDLSAAYRALVAGEQPRLAPLAFTYADFCSWQKTLEDRPVGKRQLAFWERVMEGYESLELPGDRGNPRRGAVGLAFDTYAMGALPFALEGPEWSAVQALCGRLRCTPYAVFATSFLLLLMRWSGRSNAAVNSSQFHRDRPGSEAIIGNFVTPYPLRLALQNGETLEQMVRRCQDVVLANREHGQVAPTSIRALCTEWSRFNLNYLIAPDRESFDLGAARVERLEWSIHPKLTIHDLALFLVQRRTGVSGQLVYNAERFSPEQVGRAAGYLAEIIRAIATDPVARVDTIDGRDFENLAARVR